MPDPDGALTPEDIERAFERLTEMRVPVPMVIPAELAEMVRQALRDHRLGRRGTATAAGMAVYKDEPDQ